MKIAIVDDESHFRELLESEVDNFLSENNVLADVECFSCAEDFLSTFEPQKYAIVFMDVYMGEVSGIEAARNIRKVDSDLILIFCTTSPDHMPDAFEFHAFDYVVKPAVQQRVNKVLTDALQHLPQLQKYLSIDSEGQEVSIFYTDLLYVTTEGHYLRFTEAMGKFWITRMTMKELQEILKDDNRFLVINRGILISLEHVRSMDGTKCTMENGEVLPIKVRNSADIIQTWHDYMFTQIRENQSHMTERR